MKIIINIFLFLVLTFSNLFAGEIIVKVNNIEEMDGLIHFALYDDPKSFPEDSGKKIGLVEDTIEVYKNGLVIKNLEESYYAIAIYHDENSNNKFDTFLSIPKEKYGFSNDAPVFLGPPEFEDAAFLLKKNEKIQIEISLR
tara:strand:- start:589 stop:1011 length:423 start_codon:yes stop_codon:yes gene_type:complete